MSNKSNSAQLLVLIEVRFHLFIDKLLRIYPKTFYYSSNQMISDLILGNHFTFICHLRYGDVALWMILLYEEKESSKIYSNFFVSITVLIHILQWLCYSIKLFICVCNCTCNYSLNIFSFKKFLNLTLYYCWLIII